MQVYAGIGPRKTPADIFNVMVELARLLCARGWTLRTGGADGADTAFLNGCLLWEPRCELYLPEPGHNGHQVGTAFLERPMPSAYAIAAKYNQPWWDRHTEPVKALHARNAHVILGKHLIDPVRMVVTWTTDGRTDGQGRGGTQAALRICAGEAPDALVFNLARPEHMERINRFINDEGPLPKQRPSSGDDARGLVPPATRV